MSTPQKQSINLSFKDCNISKLDVNTPAEKKYRECVGCLEPLTKVRRYRCVNCDGYCVCVDCRKKLDNCPLCRSIEFGRRAVVKRIIIKEDVIEDDIRAEILKRFIGFFEELDFDLYKMGHIKDEIEQICDKISEQYQYMQPSQLVRKFGSELFDAIINLGDAGLLGEIGFDKDVTDGHTLIVKAIWQMSDNWRTDMEEDLPSELYNKYNDIDNPNLFENEEAFDNWRSGCVDKFYEHIANLYAPI